MTSDSKLISFVKSKGFFKKESQNNLRNISNEVYKAQAPSYSTSSYIPMTESQFLGGGCGTIAYKQTKNSFKKPELTSFKPSHVFLFFLLILPVFLISFLKFKVYDKQRKFERFTVKWKASLSSSVSDFFQGEVYSFSLGGLAFLSSDSFEKNFKRNQKVSFYIQNTKLEGFVRWHSGENKSLGIEFTKASRKKAEELLEKLES